MKVSKEKTMTENVEMPNETEDRQRILLADDEASIRKGDKFHRIESSEEFLKLV